MEVNYDDFDEAILGCDGDSDENDPHYEMDIVDVDARTSLFSEKPTCSKYENQKKPTNQDHTYKSSRKMKKQAQLTKVRQPKSDGHLGTDTLSSVCDDMSVEVVDTLLTDDATTNLVANLKQMYNIQPVYADVENWRRQELDEKDGDAVEIDSSDESPVDRESDEDYIPLEELPKKSNKKIRVRLKTSTKQRTPTKKAGKAPAKMSQASRRIKKVLKHRIETSFPPRFAADAFDDDSEGGKEDESDVESYDWSKLARMNNTAFSNFEKGSDEEDDDEEEDDDDGKAADNESFATKPAKKLKASHHGSSHTLPAELSSLLGQATVYFAQNRLDEAVAMCREVIRQKPNHAESYDILGSFYEKLGESEKYLQFSLLAAHLNKNCSAEKWAFLGQLALEQNHLDQALVAYEKAFAASPDTWSYYEKQIELLKKLYENGPELSLKNRLLSAKYHAFCNVVKSQQWTLEEYFPFAMDLFHNFFAQKRLGKASICLRLCLQRAYADGVVLYTELNHFLEISMQVNRYDAAAKAVFTYTPLRYTTNREDFIDMDDEHFFRVGNYIVPRDFPVDILAKTICCLIHNGQFEYAKPLLTNFEANHEHESTIDLFLDVSDALTSKYLYEEAETLLTSLINKENLATAAVWLCYADTLSALGRLESACKAYSQVVALSPKHVTARLSLSSLQTQLGLSEEALKTLDIGDVDELLEWDWRLLFQKCSVLEQQGNLKAAMRCASQFLAMAFKECDNYSVYYTLSRMAGAVLSMALRPLLLREVANCQWTRIVKKIPAAIDDRKFDMKPDEVWTIFKKVFNYHMDSKHYTEMLQLSCLAYICPKLVYSGIGYCELIIGHLLYSALQCKNFMLLFNILRHHIQRKNSTAFYNLVGLTTALSQDRSGIKWALRQTISHPDEPAFAWISGNTSILSGLYQHSLAEYASILPKYYDNPLLYLLMGTSYVSLSCKKDIVRRHDLCIQGLYFLNKYEKLRGTCQETYYNLGRAMQQIGLSYAAIYYYKKSLEEEPRIIPHSSKNMEMYDLRRFAAHNLSLIYVGNQNEDLARMYMEKYCTI